LIQKLIIVKFIVFSREIIFVPFGAEFSARELICATEKFPSISINAHIFAKMHSPPHDQVHIRES